MTRTISVDTARTELGKIMDRAIEHNERFLVERNGEPAIIIMSVNDFVKTLAPPPDWLQESWESAKREGLDKLTMEEIDEEIASVRRERKARQS